jgi:hypothetical protein
MYNLFLDDCRTPNMVYYDLTKWIIVRNFNDFKKIIKNKGIPNIISLDHDLGETNTGYDSIKWLTNYIINNNLNLPTEIRYHTSNPIGKQNMKTYYNNFIKHYTHLLNKNKKDI